MKFPIGLSIAAILSIAACRLSPSEGVRRVQEPHHVPEARFAKLTRGVSISHWWAQKQQQDYTADWVENRISSAEIRALREMGFNHIRLPVDFLSVGMNERVDKPNPIRLMTLRRKIEEMNRAGFFVVLLSHNPVELKRQFLGNEAVRRKLINFWTEVSYATEGISVESLAFELVGEPSEADGDRWWAFQEWLIKHVHGINPDRTVIANATNYASLEDLLRRKPYADRNVVYNASFYEPFVFTHQGADAGWPESKAIFGLKYPADPDNIRSRSSYITDKRALERIAEYAKGKWGRAEVRRRLVRLRDWGRTYGVKTSVNEFAVWKFQTPPGSREAWLSDVRTALEEYGIGWTHWDFRDGFGFCDSRDPLKTVDPSILKALGMPKSRYNR